MPKPKNGKHKSLSSGRPPAVVKPSSNTSSRYTRSTVRTYHKLNKRLSAAQASGDVNAAGEIEDELAKLGGLKAYQEASIRGQAKDRGGDSSKVLMEWLNDIDVSKTETKPRLLEVGALSTQNACSQSGKFTIERIDLNSQGEGIKQQDFMERPLPRSSVEQFDIISLSLVLNFVPHPAERGEMLKRTRKFLDLDRARSSFDERVKVFPALFLVLPAPCTTNSRYLSDDRLCGIMASLGYRLLHRKQTAKLMYSLWQLSSTQPAPQLKFRKEIVNDGRIRNNFSITLD